MVATDSAVLPWSRQTLSGAPAQAVASARTRADGPAQQALNAPDAETGGAGGFQPFGKDGFSFLDLVDVINPLQHIPLIGTAYRAITGDTLDPLPRIAGSTLFFGPVGAAFSGANVLLEEMSGQDAGEHIMTALGVGGESVRTAYGNTDHGVSVTAKPAAAGTDAEIASLPAAAGQGFGADAADPVSAWARGELAYRKALAAERQTDPSTLAASTAPAAAPTVAASYQSAPPPIAEPATPAPPSPLSWADKPLIDPAAFAGAPLPLAAQAAETSNAAPASDAAPNKNVQAATTETPPDLARFIQALGVAAPAAQTNAAAATQANMAPAAPAAATSKRAAQAYGRGDAAQAQTAAPTPGAPAVGGGWFAANMMHSLQQYQRQQAQAETGAPRRLDQAVN